MHDSNDEAYVGREQARIKHDILTRYLHLLTVITLRSYRDTINYVDTNAGHWQSKTEDGSDTSSYRALMELVNTRSELGDRNGRGKIKLRCLFIEADKARFELLQQRIAPLAASVDVDASFIHGQFELNVPQIMAFLRSGKSPFGFCLIDPTGYECLQLDLLAPILTVDPGEVLITFMSSFISRFLDHPSAELRQKFHKVLGASEVEIARIAELTGWARENAVVDAFRRHLSGKGHFKYVASATIARPHQDRINYHLVFGTRHEMGLKKFREVEEMAYEQQERSRVAAKAEPPTLWQNEDQTVTASRFLLDMQIEHMRTAKREVMDRLKSKMIVPYDELFAIALSHPTVTQSKLNKWLDEWRLNGIVSFQGLSSRERTLKLMHGHTVRIASKSGKE